MMIKVCGITRREDAVVAAEAGASALGFVFYPPSPRYVTPQRAAELGDGLDVWKVGIFVDESPAAIGAVMRAARLDVAQIYGGNAPGGIRVWKAFRVADSFDRSLAEGAEAVLLDGAKNGASFDWKLARGAAEKVIVAGGLSATNVAEAIRIAQPWGVDASSQLESAPGIKDHDKVRAFIEAARLVERMKSC
jgi:phosphoribosylanthranilate isomerase